MSISIIGADTKSLGDHATQDGVEGQIVAFSKQMNWYDVVATDSDLKKNLYSLQQLIWKIFKFLKALMLQQFGYMFIIGLE